MRPVIVAIAVLTVLIVGITVYQYNKPKPLNWTPTYSQYDKIPYGTYVFRDIIERVSSEKKCVNSNETPYISLAPYLDPDAETGNLYVVVNNSFNPDSLETDYLLTFVSLGNTAFVAANSFSSSFTDTLGFEEAYIWGGNDTTRTGETFVNQNLKNKTPFVFKKGPIIRGMTSFDTATTEVLAIDKENRPTLIRKFIGDGSIIISINPVAFTNYYILDKNNRGYFERATSYLQNVSGDIIWDDFYSVGKREPQSPFRFLLSQESLKYSLCLGIIGTLLYLFWFGRRKQRIIPIISPLQNSTLDFTRTVGTLYFERGNHKNIAEKKIVHFLEFLRSHFFMRTNSLDTDFRRELCEKSGYDSLKIDQLCSHIASIRHSQSISEESMISITKSIDEFYEFCGVNRLTH